MVFARTSDTRINLTLAATAAVRPGPTVLTVTTSLGSATATLTVEVLLRIPNGTIITAADTSFDNRTLAIENATITVEGSHPFQRILLTNGTLAARGTGVITVQSISLTNGSVLTHDQATSRLQLQVTDLTIDATSRIDVSARGFLGGRVGENTADTGKTLGNAAGSTATNGGSYGGLGGSDTGAVNPVYGELPLPNELGSGGGANGASEPGGNGGGLVRITATTITLNGAIRADGIAGTASGGGGSGGGIFIQTNTLSGTGNISANGGNSTQGAGGGGRIAIRYEALTLPRENITALGGQGAQNGGAGTILLHATNHVNGELAVANGNRTPAEASTPLRPVGTGTITALTVTTLTNANANFPVPDSATGTVGLIGLAFNPNIAQAKTFTIINNSATTLTIDAAEGDLTTVAQVGNTYRGVYRFDTVTIQAKASVQVADRLEATTLSLNDGTLVADGSVKATTFTVGSLLTHSPTTLTREPRLEVEATTLTVAAEGQIIVDRRGFLGGFQGANQQEQGRTQGNQPGSGLSTGGSHGGLGELVNSPLAPTYGAFDNPTDLGGGGGAANIFELGGNGGGRIQISATTLTVNGVISANGTASTGGGGGGSGGSIRITTSTLDGNGQIRAAGENSTKGGGGGGRIAITFQTMTLPQANLSVAGGTGSPGGAEGTIFLQPGGVISSPPALASIEPTTGSSSGGTSITLTGTNFKSGATVTMGGNAATDVVVISSTRITAVTPARALGPADVVVTNPEGLSATLTRGFTYITGLIRVASITPDRGPKEGGTPATITGEGFAPGVEVTIGGSAATNVVVVSSTQITAVTPPGSVGPADVVVRDPGSGVSGTLAGGFAYVNLIPDGMVIGPDDTTFDRQDISIEAGTVTIEGRHTFRSITLANGGILTHPASTAAAVPRPLELTIETRLSIDAASRIDVSGWGFLGGRSGNNADNAGRTLGNLAGSGPSNGGSYGGLGGLSSARGTVAAAYGNLHNPMLMGSGGGGEASTNSAGGNGGGLVRITATDIELNGAILANGTAGTGPNGGGGSGGSILITATKLTGTGRIEANGGSVEGPNSGTGGGGRIALLVDDLSGFDLTQVQARGGAATLTGGEHGGAGTIFVRRAGQTDGDLIVDTRALAVP